jgi:hypothetical protein
MDVEGFWGIAEEKCRAMLDHKAEEGEIESLEHTVQPPEPSKSRRNSPGRLSDP